MSRARARAILIFLFLISSFAGIIPAGGQFNEGYGEDQTSLGQFVDSFETSNNISVTVDVIRNTTLKVMELNQTGTIILNLTTYSEIDAGGYIDKNDSTVEWTQQIRNTDSRIRGDFGAGFFTDFYYEFYVEFTDIEAGDASANDFQIVFGITDVAGDFNNMWANKVIAVMVSQDGAIDDRVRFKIQIRKGGGTSDSDLGAFRNIAGYYCIFNRTGNDVSFLAFSDSGRTALVEKLDATAWADTLRYMQLAVSRNAASDPNDHSSGFIENITVPEEYFGSGYFTTVDYLSDPLAKGSVLVSMVNTSIPANTGILLQFSDDNVTWGDDQGTPGNSMSLTGGFESYDLRDLNYSTGYYSRFNLSTTDTSITPRVHQNRVITTIGNVSTVIQNVSSAWVTYNLAEIGVTVGTLDSGNLNSTLDIDGDMYNVSELVGAPGMIISGNFSGVDPDADCLWVVIYAHYDGNLNHDFDIEVWNFTSSAWVEDSHITDGTDLMWFNSTIYGLRIPNEFLSGEEVRVRLDHEDAGNINHDIFIEYFKLLAEIPAGPTIGAGAVTIVESDFPWIAIAIILMCVAYLLFRPK